MTYSGLNGPRGRRVFGTLIGVHSLGTLPALLSPSTMELPSRVAQWLQSPASVTYFGF